MKSKSRLAQVARRTFAIARSNHEYHSSQVEEYFGFKSNSLQESKLSVVCERVLDRCLAPSTVGGEGCDNMTMILVQFKKPTCSNSAASSEVLSSPSKPDETESKPVETESKAPDDEGNPPVNC